MSDVMLEKFWQDNGECHSLSTVIGPEPWLLFEKMKMEELEMECLQLELSQWQLLSGYPRLSQFIRGITVVNDLVKHRVKDIQVNYISRSYQH